MNCSEQIRMTRTGGRSVVEGSADQSANNAQSPSTAMKSMPLNSTTRSPHSRISLRACGLNSSMSDASISPSTVIEVTPASVRIPIGVSRQSVDVASFRCGAWSK